MKFVRGALRCAGLERRRDHQGHVGVRRWVSNYPSNDSRVSPDFGLALNAQTTSLESAAWCLLRSARGL